MNKTETFRYYESIDGVYGVKLPKQALQRIRDFCKNSYPYETGGILIGRYSEDLKWAEITAVTGAPEDSKRARCSFIRSTQGIISKLRSAWKKRQYYIGEWHYHPDATPHPSRLDSQTMFDLSKSEELHCPEPILLIIGGAPYNWNQYIGVYAKDQEIEIFEINAN